MFANGAEPTSTLFTSTPEERNSALEKALTRSGFTAAQLMSQAADGHFATSQARKAWVAVGGLIDGGQNAGQLRS